MILSADVICTERNSKLPVGICKETRYCIMFIFFKKYFSDFDFQHPVLFTFFRDTFACKFTDILLYQVFNFIKGAFFCFTAVDAAETTGVPGAAEGSGGTAGHGETEGRTRENRPD